LAIPDRAAASLAAPACQHYMLTACTAISQSVVMYQIHLTVSASKVAAIPV
jgi:hypothetical protein